MTRFLTKKMFLFSFLFIWGGGPSWCSSFSLENSLDKTKSALPKLYKEFLEQNKSLVIGLKEVEMTKLKRDFLNGERSWNTFGSLGAELNRGDGVGGKDANYGDRRKVILGVQKKTLWGGDFSIGESFIFSNLEGSPMERSLGDLKENFYQKMEFSFSQDLGRNFFGRISQGSMDLAYFEEKISKEKFLKKKEDLLEAFHLQYLETQKSYSLMTFQKMALDRALERKSLIQKRVKDGLNDPVDLVQVQLRVETVKENLSKASLYFKGQLSHLSLYLGRSLAAGEILLLKTWRKDPLVIWPKGKLERNKKNIYLKNEIKLLSDELVLLKKKTFPSLQLKLSYGVNALKKEGSKAFFKGQVGAGKWEGGVMLSFSMPWNFPLEKTQRLQKKSEKKIKELKLKQHQESLSLLEENMIEQLKGYKKQVVISKRRIRLAKKTLKLLAHLYNLGKRNLDSLIMGEEDLILAQKSLMENLVAFKKMKAKKAKLSGHLEEMLKKAD